MNSSHHENDNSKDSDLVTDESACQIKIDPCKNRPHRKRRDCPIPGCKARSLLKLADHLHCSHHIDDWLRRSDLLKMVRISAII